MTLAFEELFCNISQEKFLCIYRKEIYRINEIPPWHQARCEPSSIEYSRIVFHVRWCASKLTAAGDETRYLMPLLLQWPTHVIAQHSRRCWILRRPRRLLRLLLLHSHHRLGVLLPLRQPPVDAAVDPVRRPVEHAPVLNAQVSNVPLFAAAVRLSSFLLLRHQQRIERQRCRVRRAATAKQSGAITTIVLELF